MAHASAGDGWVGQPLKRREDRRLLLGAGRYVDDISPRGCAHVVLLRSPHAHARIVTVDVGAARKAPGVITVATGSDVKHLGPMPVNRLMPDMRVPPHPIIADGLVHAAGTPVAAVVADTVYAARDAAELIRVDYEPLPALASPEAAVAAGAPVLFPDIEGNRSLRPHAALGRRRACARGFGRAWCRSAWSNSALPAWPWSRGPCSPSSTCPPRS